MPKNLIARMVLVSAEILPTSNVGNVGNVSNALASPPKGCYPPFSVRRGRVKECRK